MLNRMYALYPGQRATGEVLLDGENILAPASTWRSCAPGSAWCSRSRRRFRCRVFDNVAFGVRLYERMSRADMDEPRRGGADATRRCGTR